MLRQYFRNIWLFLHVHWLWTRDLSTTLKRGMWDDEMQVTFAPPPAHMIPERLCIQYKRGWTPLRFLPIYLLDYGCAVLLGRGVQSLSRAFRLLGRDHYTATGPLLWGSVDLKR